VLFISDAVALDIPNVTKYLDLIKTFYSVLVTFVIPGSLLIITKAKKNEKSS